MRKWKFIGGSTLVEWLFFAEEVNWEFALVDFDKVGSVFGFTKAMIIL
jgi:hypothetical protein